MAPVLRHCPCLRPENDDVKTLDYSHSNMDDVPNEVFSFERTLEELYLEANQIKDLPRPLFHCHGLRKLNLSDNEIHALPPAVASLINLEQLDISKNGVMEIPDNIKGCKCLSLIDASVNPLGKLPEGFTQLINLQELYLNDTFLEYLPANFGRLCKLKILELRENHLKVLPKSMARLTELCRLDIGQNDFSDLPEVIGNLPRLVELWCDCNNLSCLPPFLGGLKKLAYLDASKNRIYDVADEIEGCSSLCDVTLSSNRIKELPDGIANLRKMTVLRVDSNRLISIPLNIGNLIYLEELVLSSNDLTKLPYTVGLLRNMKTLIADDNLLEELPCEMGSCQKLTILSVRDNKLLHIPDELGHISTLKVINLSGNLLQYLPFSIAKLPNLQALWLSENQNKPLVPLQSDADKATGQKVLTCFMLPQVPMEDDGPQEVNNQEAMEVTGEGKGRQLIKFAFDIDKDQPSKLVRAPTPYPKELKAHARHARNYALKKQGFKDTEINHRNVEALRRKGAPPDIMLLPSSQPVNAKAKVKEAAVISHSKSPPCSPSQQNRGSVNDPKVNQQSSVESSGSDIPAKNLGRRDSRGDGSSSENTSSSPVGSPKAGAASGQGHAASNGESRFKKNSNVTSSKRDTWMRQRLVRQGSGDSDRGYRSDHEVYLAERDQYGIYSAHSDGYASDWEAFLAKQNYASNGSPVQVPHQYIRQPVSSYRGNAEGQEVQGDADSTYWPGYQYAEQQDNESMNGQYQEMVLNQQGYWQADPSYGQYYPAYDPSQQENPGFYYPRNEVPVQPVDYYHASAPPPQVPPHQNWQPRPVGIVGSRTLPRRFSASSPHMKRAHCISVQAPLHSTPQEYHLMPQAPGNMRTVSPGNSPLPGRSPSPRMEAKFAYPPPRMPIPNAHPQGQYPAAPITAQPVNAVQYPVPPVHPAYYNSYHDSPPMYPMMQPSPRMKHVAQPYPTSVDDSFQHAKPYVPHPGFHNAGYYTAGRVSIDGLGSGVRNLSDEAKNWEENGVHGQEHYRVSVTRGAEFPSNNLQYRTASIPIPVQNLECNPDEVSINNVHNFHRSVPCINIIPSTSPPQTSYIEQPYSEMWKDGSSQQSENSSAANNADVSGKDGSEVNNSKEQGPHDHSDMENLQRDTNSQVSLNTSSATCSVSQTTASMNMQTAQSTNHTAEQKIHRQGVYKAMPLRSSFKGTHKVVPKNEDIVYSQQCAVNNLSGTALSTTATDAKRTSDYENIEALQYHDYQNLPPISSQSSVMSNFKRECSQIKNSALACQTTNRRNVLVRSNSKEAGAVINADVSINGEVVSVTTSDNQQVHSVNVPENVIVKTCDEDDNVSELKDSKNSNLHLEADSEVKLSVSVAAIAGRINQSVGQQQPLAKSEQQVNASSEPTKPAYAISSLDTPICSQRKPSPANATPHPSAYKTNSGENVHALPKYTVQNSNISQAATSKMETMNPKSNMYPGAQTTVSYSTAVEYKSNNRTMAANVTTVHGQQQIMSSTEMPTKSLSNADELGDNNTKSHTPNKCFHKVLPPFDKTHQLKSTQDRNTKVENTSNEQSPQRHAHDTSRRVVENNTNNLNEVQSIVKHMNKPNVEENSCNYNRQESVKTSSQPVESSKAPPAVHTKQSSNHISNVTQQLINSINKKVSDVPNTAPDNKADVPDLVNLVESDVKSQIISTKEKEIESFNSVDSEDKVLNNKVNVSQDIDEEKNHIKSTESSNILESPKSPKKNAWFFGSHKNSMVFPVVVVKNPGLGFTIEGGIGSQKIPSKPTDNGIYVAHVASDGPASGALRTGDKILQANGVDFSYLHLEKAASFLNSKEPTLSLMISRD